MHDSTKAEKARFFDGIASSYDAHRSSYPDDLIDRACALADLRPGDRVLEIGPGTGHLTVALAARRLAVTAVEPGAQLIEIARAKVPEVEFIHATLEDAPLPDGHFRAVFAASAIHWPDPDVSWRRIADTLAPDGTLVLITHVGLRVPGDDEAAVRAILDEVAPEVFRSFPVPPTQAELAAHAERHRANISRAWERHTLQKIGRDYVSDRFRSCALDIGAEVPLEQSAAALFAMLATTSSFSGLSEVRRAEISARLTALEAELGRPLRTTRTCVAMTAPRR